MIAFGHTAAGAAIGLITYQTLGQTNPGLGIILAAGASFAAHYFEDSLPHGHFFPDKEYKKKIIYVIIFDLFLSIFFFLAKAYLDFGIGVAFWFIFTGIFASQMPDAFEGLIRIGLLKRAGILKAEEKFHNLVHWHGTGSKALLLSSRDIWQLILIIISFIYI